MEMRPFAWFPGPDASEQDQSTNAATKIRAIASLRML